MIDEIKLYEELLKSTISSEYEIKLITQTNSTHLCTFSVRQIKVAGDERATDVWEVYDKTAFVVFGIDKVRVYPVITTADVQTTCLNIEDPEFQDKLKELIERKT